MGSAGRMNRHHSNHLLLVLMKSALSFQGSWDATNLNGLSFAANLDLF